MANLFETKYEDKQRVIDESVIYTAFIVTTINKNGHTVSVELGWSVFISFEIFLFYKYFILISLSGTRRRRLFIETQFNCFLASQEYVLQVQRGIDSTETWQILKRYNDFVKLHKSLACSELCPELPKKKFIGNMHPSFIAQRRFELQEYLKTVLMNPILASSLTTKKFIDPEQYMQPFHGEFLGGGRT